MVCQNFVNAGLADIRDHLAELPNRHPSIFQHCFFHFRNRFVRNRWPSRTLFVMDVCMSVFEFSAPFAERNSHLAGEVSGSSISNGCQAKTERRRQLAGAGTGRGGTKLHASAPGSRVTAFLTTAAPWEPYFTDNLRTCRNNSDPTNGRLTNTVVT
jgi:hypothetical protein